LTRAPGPASRHGQHSFAAWSRVPPLNKKGDHQ
jgi:hypothetical protein